MRERAAQKVIAASFFLLAPYIAVEAVWRLTTGSRAQASWVGIGLTISSLILMPLPGPRETSTWCSAAVLRDGGRGVPEHALRLLVAGGSARAERERGTRSVVGGPGALLVAGMAFREGVLTWRGEVREDCC